MLSQTLRAITLLTVSRPITASRPSPGPPPRESQAMSAGPHRQGELHRAARTRSDILRWLAHREAAADASGTVRTLLCGHRSFAARGLAEALEGAGHQVVRFSRGEVGRAQRSVSGPVDLL